MRLRNGSKAVANRLKPLLAAAVAGAALLSTPAAASECEDLANLTLGTGKVTSATVVAPGAFQQPAAPGGPPPGVLNAAYRDLPEFCRVQATLTPSTESDIKVEIWLPTKGWNGKYVGIGNGIWAGQLSYSQLGDPLSRGYAVATTDTGHTGNGMSADFAVGHPEKLVDFGHRAVHEMTLAAKRAIAEFYGRSPTLSLWNSCSTGGRQGLMEAFRYPEDYDAISAMAPANPMTDLMVQTMWAGWQPQREPGAALSMPKLSALHRAAIAACDKDDGVEEGLISQPDQCRFDPATIQCRAGDGEDCLSALQVETARALYAGIPDPRTGNTLLPGWPRGSEMQWAAVIMGQQPFPVANTYFSMLVFGDQPGWDWRSFDYLRGFYTARDHGAAILNVPADGMDAFFARGGKLLLSHGWGDGLIPAWNSEWFYRGLYHDLPRQQAEHQLRLFFAPGMDHCSGGEGPSQFDTLGVIDDWASTGRAPNRIIATRPTAVPAMPGAPAAPPRAPLSRPLCPYPLVAEYDGEGDVAAAENFRCAAPPAG